MAVLKDNIKIDQAIKDLKEHKDEWVKEAITTKIELLKEVLINLKQNSQELVDVTHEHQRIKPDSKYAFEAWGGGVWAMAATLQGYIATLMNLSRGQDPEFKSIKTTSDGKLKIRIYPNNLIENLLLHGLYEEVWMHQDVTRENLKDHLAVFYKEMDKKGKVGLVLGAGNVFSIPVLDSLNKLIVDGEVVILKMNPVNDYTGPVLEKVLSPLVRKGYLRFVYGDKDVGEYMIHHPDIDSILLTGSLKTHDNIVFGPGEEGKKRKKEGNPVISKPVKSELGGVAPIIVLPGKWSKSDLQFQAEHIVSMKMYNCGFVCVSPQILVLPEQWDQKEALLEAIRKELWSLPARWPYYPGVKERYQEAVASQTNVEKFNGEIPATLITDLDPDNNEEYLFKEEVFGPVLGVTSLPGSTAEEFLSNAVKFANNRLSGTLGANIFAHPDTLKEMGNKLEHYLASLKYGSIGINTWNAMAFLLPYTPWGAYPVKDGEALQSGKGVAHNAFMLDKVDKTIVTGPFHPFPRSFANMKFTMMPKPSYFITNKESLEVNRKVAQFTIDQDLKRLPGLFATAMKG